MEHNSEHSKREFDRRRFISDGVKITLLAGILSPLEQACNSKTKNTDKKKPKDKSNPVSKNNKRRKWNAEKLVINTKSNIIHLPTASFYIYYDEIKNLREISIDTWESHLSEQVRLNKNKSGNIIEVLSLQKLRHGVSDNSLTEAAKMLALSFGKDYENSKGLNVNITNYRLHELMLQLISLNNSMSYKWQTFNSMVLKPQKPGKRQAWMADENNFNQRVKYIQDREAEYQNRLVKRASKYNLT